MRHYPLSSHLGNERMVSTPRKTEGNVGAEYPPKAVCFSEYCLHLRTKTPDCLQFRNLKPYNYSNKGCGGARKHRLYYFSGVRGIRHAHSADQYVCRCKYYTEENSFKNGRGKLACN